MGKINNAILLASEKGVNIINGVVYGIKGKELKLQLTCKGDNLYYYFFWIKLNKCTISIPVHRFVAFKKYGKKIFENGVHVRHLDSDSLNNLDYNIGIGSAKDNMMDKDPEKRLRAAKIASSYAQKHNHNKIIEMYNEGMSYCNIMDLTGIKSKGTISFIIKKSVESKKK